MFLSRSMFYLLVIIFRASSDPKSRELKVKNGKESATCGWFCARVSPSATFRKNLSRDQCALGVPVQQNTISFHIHFREYCEIIEIPLCPVFPGVCGFLFNWKLLRSSRRPALKGVKAIFGILLQPIKGFAR